MRRSLYLAWRYIAYHRIKTGILIICLTLTLVLPLSAHLLIRYYDQVLRARAAATPRVVGAPGNRFDLVLKTLYFQGATLDPVYWSEVEELWESGMATPIPLELSYTARGFPIVGTTFEYFEFRALAPAQGTLPARIGHCVLGAQVAAQLGLGPGDTLMSDQKALYDITQTYPLLMDVCGVLAPTGTADDRAVFVDVKTTWIIAGISHGHEDVTALDDPNLIVARDEREVVTNTSIYEFTRITPENIHTFHTHAPPSQLPLSAVIVLPDGLPTDTKAATILGARYNHDPLRRARMLDPAEVVRELMERVVEIQRVFNACFALVAVSTGLFLVLVVLLSQRLRQREMETMYRLGCARAMTFRLQAGELGLILIASVALAAMLAGATLVAAPRLLNLL